jgi:hypothetical protein
MNGRYKMMTGVAAGIGLVLLGSVLAGFSQTETPGTEGQDIDPTADIHPSVILEGKVKVGAYTKIDAGTIITGNVTIAKTISACCLPPGLATKLRPLKPASAASRQIGRSTA